VAVYACAPADLLEVVSLRTPVESRVVVERTPFVEPLVAQGDGERWAVLLANRRSARVFQGHGRDVEETDRIEDEVHRQHDQGGWSQLNYQRSVEKDVYDHMAHVADVLFGIYKQHGLDHLLIGGPEELLGDVERHLHRYLRERIVGRLHLDVENSGIEDVRSAVAGELERHETQREREALDRLAEGVGRGTRGAGGLADVLAALDEGRVECLLVADGFSAAGLRDRETGMLYAEENAPRDRPLERVEDVVEPAIEKAIEQSARVLRVSRHDDLGPLGGIGAVLRY
jgi:peptide chain release factor subunit 1